METTTGTPEEQLNLKLVNISKKSKEGKIVKLKAKNIPFFVVDLNADGEYFIKDSFNGADMNRYEVYKCATGRPYLLDLEDEDADTLSFAVEDED